MLSIVTCSWFETARDYELQILEPKIKAFSCLLHEIHCVAKVYAVLPVSTVKCLYSGGQEWEREGSHSH